MIEPSLDELKWQHHAEIVAGSMIGGAAYRYRITDAGRERAALFFEQNHYVGFAPVPLDHYRRYLENFRRTLRQRRVTCERARRIQPAGPERPRARPVGPAVRAGRSLFVYGPPGNGKTVISQSIRNLLLGEIAVPHALAVEGAIIRFFDPVNHEALLDAAPAEGEPARPRLPPGRPMGALPAPLDHRRRRAHARVARAELRRHRPGSIARRSRPSPTAACSSSTTSAASTARPGTC